ncbi:MAG: RNA polymerase sigma factor region1.1 domain-containing protein [Candidatus Dormibacteraceae bacterium]
MKVAKAKVEPRFEDLLVQAETLIVRGKDQGYLSPDEVLDGLPEIATDNPEQLFRIFAFFKMIGVEVSDAAGDFEEKDNSR